MFPLFSSFHVTASAGLATFRKQSSADSVTIKNHKQKGDGGYVGNSE